MDNWRRHRGELYHQEVQGSRSQVRKPPQGSWKPTVPSWEKKFCSSIGSVPWTKLLETKRLMYLYENVLQWNDSAGEEAFHNAKNRFWAEINGLPCNISLPDPDIYIDEIDWDASVDPELLLDLERDPKVPEDVNKDEKVVILNNSVLFHQAFSCTGWGDAEEGFHKDTGLCLAPGCKDCNQNAGNDKSSWDHNCAPPNAAKKDDQWRNQWNDTWGLSQLDNNCNDRDNSYNDWRNIDNRRSVGDWGTWNGNSRKREGTGWYMSRYKTSRFHGDDYQMGRGWRSKRGGWKRSNMASERPFIDENNSSGQWNTMNSCGPVYHNGFGQAGLSWGWEKQVL